MTENEPSAHPGWTPLAREQVPRPTYFPAGLALGVAFIFWGFVISLVMVAAGLGLFIAALAGWIREIRYERKHR